MKEQDMKRPQPWLMFATDPGDGGGSTPPEPTESGQKQEAKTFTQDEVNVLVRERAERLYKQRVGDVDVDTIKANSKTLEDRLAEVEKRAADAEAKALRSDIAAKFGISPEDRDLFLTGADEETLVAQAQRLAQREADRKKQGNVAPREGNNPTPGTGDKDGLRDFTRNLFASAAADD